MYASGNKLRRYSDNESVTRKLSVRCTDINESDRKFGFLSTICSTSIPANDFHRFPHKFCENEPVSSKRKKSSNLQKSERYTSIDGKKAIRTNRKLNSFNSGYFFQLSCITGIYKYQRMKSFVKLLNFNSELKLTKETIAQIDW